MMDHDPDASIIRLDGGRHHEAFAVITHCPICKRGRSEFFADFDKANAWLSIQLSDLRCGPCRRNGDVMG